MVIWFADALPVRYFKVLGRLFLCDVGATLRRLLIVGLSIGLLAANTAPARAAGPNVASLSRADITPGLGHASRLRRADPNRQMKVAVALRLRNEASLDAFIASASSPGSRRRGQYLSPAEFTARYGPTPGQMQTVQDHLQRSGLTVKGVSPNRTIVDAHGPVRAVEAAFGVAISDWHDRDRNRDFFGNDTQPVLPSAIAPLVVAIAGLNNHYELHRSFRQPELAAPSAAGPAGGYTPTELRSAYHVEPLETATVPGSGQALGLFELDSFNQANITVYDTNYGLLTLPPKVVTVDSGPTSSPGGETEVELDIEVMHALAPASPITVWEGPNTGDGVLHTYNAMVVSNTTPANSTSWGICEPNTTAAEVGALDNIFKQAAAQGQSFFAASGDNGAYDCAGSNSNPSSGLAVDSPADDPYVTGVGGTALSLNAAGGYGSETVWSNTAKTPNLGSGGGLSTMFARPSWQVGPGVANSFSNGMRQVPDVALDADPRTGYSIYTKTSSSAKPDWYVFGGTSASAPAWAAITSLANQYSTSHGGSSLGFANPVLYNLGSTAPLYPPFHDITSGDNLYYPATPSWDFATGWGSVDAYNLARDLPAPGPHRLTPSTATNSRSESAPPAVPQSSPTRRSVLPPGISPQTPLASPGTTTTRSSTTAVAPVGPSMSAGASAAIMDIVAKRIEALLSWLDSMPR